MLVFYGCKSTDILPQLIDASIFTALHVMQTRYSGENSVRPPVRPSHAWIVTKRKKDLFRFLHNTKDNVA